MFAKIKRLRYQRVGAMLTHTALTVEYEINGNIYDFQIPMDGWNVNVPGLQFLVLYKLKPSDFDEYGRLEVDNKYVKVTATDPPLLANSAFNGGKEELENAEWFNPELEVSELGEMNMRGGRSTDPSPYSTRETVSEASIEIE